MAQDESGFLFLSSRVIINVELLHFPSSLHKKNVLECY